jgi:hypothetical protein
MVNRIKILQANAHFDKAAMDETLNLIRTNSYQLALLQEPYCYKKNNIFTTPKLGNLKLIAKQNTRYYSCIITNDSNLNVLYISHLSTEYISVISLQRRSLPLLFLISVYSPPNPDDLRRTINELQTIIDQLTGNQIIIGGDFNCRSTVWFDKICDRNCHLMEEFIVSNDLVIFNEDHNPPTFETSNGNSNIDLTLGTQNLISEVKNWEVLENATSSDHRPISYDTTAEPQLTKSHKIEYVYDQNNLNMEKLGPQLRQLSQNLINKYPVLISQNTIDNALEEFYDGIRRILGKAAKMRKTYPTRPTWWSDKIERLRKVYLQKKNMLYKNTDLIRKNYLAQEMIQAKEKFKNEIITTQERAWSKFVESDLGPNPWGVIYKMSTEKFHKLGALGAFMKGDDITMSSEQAMKHLMDSLLPDDNANEDNHTHHIWRQEFEAIQSKYVYDIPEVTEEELSEIISRLKPKKSPGLDRLRGSVLKMIHPHVAMFLVHLLNACLRASYFPRTWKTGDLKILLKDPSGDMSSVKNYRPITLLPEYGKIFEKIVRKRLYEAQPQLHSPNQWSISQAGSPTTGT